MARRSATLSGVLPPTTGLLHAEVGDGHVGARHAQHADAALGQVGRELVVGDGDVGELGRHAVPAGPARRSGTTASAAAPPRSPRSAPGRSCGRRRPLNCCGDGLQPRIVGAAAARRRAPRGSWGSSAARMRELRFHCASRYGAGAHRVLADLVAVGLDHLARQRAGEGAVGQVVEEARAGLGQPDLEGVAVQRAQALDLGVVVEGLLRRRWPACAARSGPGSWRSPGR